MEGRKQAISLRLSLSDIRRIKRLAQRLDVRDSDVVRFAVKMMLSRLGPLSDPNVRGRALVPMFVESGADVVGYFDLDAGQLETIINEGVDSTQRVEPDDIQLMSMVGTQKAYARLSLRRLTEGSGSVANGESADDTLAARLRRLLYSKYGYSEQGADVTKNGASSAGSAASVGSKA